jgi:hypothetical protein
LRRLSDSIGRRGAVLIVLAIVDVAYGSAITYARTVQGSDAVWWPASQDTLLFLPTEGWGWVWVIVGALLLTGVWHRSDRWQYSLASGLKACWACAAFTSPVQGLWGVVSLYIGFAVVIFIVSGWPEDSVLIREEDRQ